eukprot:3600231-Pleurochrysis_carterae.AAC.1
MRARRRAHRRACLRGSTHAQTPKKASALIGQLPSLPNKDPSSNKACDSLVNIRRSPSREVACKTVCRAEGAP